MKLQKTILLVSLGLLSLTACNKKKNEMDENLGNPEKALNSFIHQESTPIAAQWIYKKGINNQWTGSFDMQQNEMFVHKIKVNDDWQHVISEKTVSFPFTAADFTTLSFDESWDIDVWGSNEESNEDEFEVSKRLQVDIDLEGLNYINPNHGFSIYLDSDVSVQPSNKSGEMEIVLYAKNSDMGIHHFMTIPVSASSSSVRIEPEMLIGFQQFNDLEIHVFQREIMYSQWFGKEVLLQVVTAQVFKHAFSIY